MKRSFAAAPAAMWRSRVRDRSPWALRRQASTPFSMVRESSRSSSAVNRLTMPIALRYRPTESLIFESLQRP